VSFLLLAAAGCLYGIWYYSFKLFVYDMDDEYKATTESMKRSIKQIEKAQKMQSDFIPKRDSLKTKKQAKEYKSFNVSCQGVKFLCKRSEANFCSKELEDQIVSVCQKMESNGLAPATKLQASVLVYRVCEGKLRVATGCLPTMGFRNGRGLLMLPENYIFRKDFKAILSHEIVHAFLYDGTKHASKLVHEFFAVYVENIFTENGMERELFACTDKESNQPVLSTDGGKYLSDSFDDFPALVLLRGCRYGQLQYAAKRLSAFPKVFPYIWKKIASSPQFVDTVVLRDWIYEADNEAWKVIYNLYILSEQTKTAHIAMILDKDKRGVNFFTLQAPSSDPRTWLYNYDGKIYITIERNGKLTSFAFAIIESITRISADFFRSGDRIYAMTAFDDILVGGEFLVP